MSISIRINNMLSKTHKEVLEYLTHYFKTFHNYFLVLWILILTSISLIFIGNNKWQIKSFLFSKIFH